MHDTHHLALPAVVLALVISAGQPASQSARPPADSAAVEGSPETQDADVDATPVRETISAPPEALKDTTKETLSSTVEAKGFCSTLSPQLMRMTRDAWHRR